MKRLPHVVMLLVAVALVAADKGEKKKSDAEKIQGKWKVVESHYKGKEFDVQVDIEFTFSGKTILITYTGDDDSVAAIELRPDKKPAELDLIPKGNREMTIKAIYKFSGDTLKICVMVDPIGKPRSDATVRPDSIGSAASDERYVYVLKRVKSNDKK